MKFALQLGGLVLAGLLGWAGYVEFFDPCSTGIAQATLDSKGWAMHNHVARSPLLNRETLRLTVIRQASFPMVDNGRSVKIAGHTLRGIGRVFLVDRSGTPTETLSSVPFLKNGSSITIREHLRGLPADEALRKFLE